MKQTVIVLEIILIALFIADMMFHFMSATIANPLLFILLATSFYLFKPYFIWSDLNKRRREMKDKENKEHL